MDFTAQLGSFGESPSTFAKYESVSSSFDPFSPTSRPASRLSAARAATPQEIKEKQKRLAAYEEGLLEKRYRLHEALVAKMLESFEQREQHRLSARRELAVRPTRLAQFQRACRFAVIVLAQRFASLGWRAAALSTLRKLFGGVVMLNRRKARRVKELSRRLGQHFAPEMRSLEPSILKAIPALSSWTDDQLRGLSRRATPIVYYRGESIFMEGDPGDRMYILHQGTVVFSEMAAAPTASGVKPAVRSKSRLPQKGAVVGTLSGRGYFGDSVVVCTELPRTVSAWVTSEVALLWGVSRGDVLAESGTLRPSQQEAMAQVADDFRRRKMFKVHSVSAAALKRLPIFMSWDEDKLLPVVKGMVPMVFHPGSVVVRQGEWD
eukprot:RCo038671